MKRYNIIEVLNSPAGTKFKDNDNTIWEVKKSEPRGKFNYLENVDTHGEMALNSIATNLEFEKIQEPLNFIRIAKKIIENNDLLVRVKHNNLIDNTVIKNIQRYKLLQKYTTFGQTIINLKSVFNNSQVAKIIIEGEWYIKED